MSNAADASARAPVRLLEVGSSRIAESALVGAIGAAFAGRAELAGLDCNARCYRIDVTDESGALVALIAKVARHWSGRTNPDETFAHEARVLAELRRLDPSARGVPAFVARARSGTEFCLLMNRHPGANPDSEQGALTPGRIASILEAALRLDRAGFQHYDLKLANILVHADQAAFCDFEFGRFEGTLRLAATDAAAHRYAADFNAWANPHLRARCNAANFEFRGLASVLDRATAEDPAGIRRHELLARYLRERGRYHLGLAELLRETAASGAENPRGLERAARHEEAMAELMARPPAAAVAVELALARWRSAAFFGGAARVRAARSAATSAVSTALAAGARGSLGDYLRAAAGTVERIGAARPPGRAIAATRALETAIRHMP